MQAVEEVEPMLRTHQDDSKSRPQTANRKLSNRTEDEEVSEGRSLICHSNATSPCHKKAQDFFKDPDSDSEDFDGYESRH